jgi:8-oxo-dGTP pyrophosphatase MutT (NUDIX family)
MRSVKCGAIIIDSSFNVLMVKGREHGKWGLPKGKEKKIDSSHLSTAAREVYEETSIDITKYKIISQVSYCNIIFFIVQVPKNIFFRPIDTNEVEDIRFWGIHELNNYYINLNSSAKNFISNFNSIIEKVKC